MEITFVFILNSVLFGLALAMDAFSVSVANGIQDNTMSHKRSVLIAGTFAFFQTAMPLLGWILVHFLVETFTILEPYIPWAAMIILAILGGKMIYDGIKGEEEEASKPLKGHILLLQGIATSIDALSVGFTISELTFGYALIEAGIIGVVTLGICLIGLLLGRKIGSKLTKHATIIGGVILILIGLEILITSFF